MKKSIFYEHIEEAAKQENSTVIEMVEYAASLGYSACDVRWQSAEALRLTFEILGGFDMKIASVYRFWNVFSIPSPTDASRFFQALSDCGCRTAMIVPWRAEKKPFTDADFHAVCESLKELCAVAQNYGVTVTVEDFDSDYIIINNMGAVKRALDSVPSLYYSFDTGNFSFFKESEIEAFELFKARIKNVHVKDRAFTPLTDGDGALPSYACSVGKGCLKIKECLWLLDEIGYDGYLSVEQFGHRKMKDAMRESAEFLDSVLASKG